MYLKIIKNLINFFSLLYWKEYQIKTRKKVVKTPKDLLNWTPWLPSISSFSSNPTFPTISSIANSNEVEKILKLAISIKKSKSKYSKTLKGKNLIMLFQKTSTRTRVSFELGIYELGGHSIYLDWDYTNFNLSKIEYEAKCLSGYTNLIMARLKKNEDLIELANTSTVPVINGCCNKFHPCQVLADFLTIYENNNYNFKNVNLTYIGIHNNIANSLVELAYVFKINLTLVCPIADKEIVDEEGKRRLHKANLLKETLDIKEGIKNANFIYTDTWIDMEYFNKPEYIDKQKAKISLMLPYQINKELLLNSNAKIFHDMPIHENYEITKDVVYDKNSLIFEQAKNRLHVQKAIMLYLYWNNL